MFCLKKISPWDIQAITFVYLLSSHRFTISMPILLNVAYSLLFELSIRSISFNEYSSISKISDSALSFSMR